jgi:multiple sugar transport system substrate-binding protein
MICFVYKAQDVRNGTLRDAQTRRGFAARAGKVAAAWTAALVGAAGASACTVGSGDGAPPAAVSKEPVKLLFGRRSVASEAPLYESYLQKHQQVAPNVTVEFVTLPSGLQEQRDGLITAFASGTGPDLLISDGPWLPEFATKGILDPMPTGASRYLKDNFTDGGQRYGTYQGTPYVFPHDTSMQLLFFSRTIFTRAGLDPKRPPRTWAEFRDYARRTTAAGGEGGAALAGFRANNRLSYMNNIIWNHKGQVVNEDEYGNVKKPLRLTLGETPAMAALQLMHTMHTADRSATVESGPNFQQGTLAMQVLTNRDILNLKRQNPALDFDVATFPTELAASDHGIGGWSWGVAKPSKKKEPAWALLQWLNSKENILAYMEVQGSTSTHKGVIADPQAVAADPEKNRVLYQVMQRATHVRPKLVVWSQIEAVVEPVLQQMFAGAFTPRELIENVRPKVETLFASEP